MDCCPKNLEKFVDLDECLQLIDDLNTKISNTDIDEDPTRSSADSEKLVETFRKKIDNYLEQPELLEPYLSELIQKLTSSLKGLSHKSVKYHVIFKYLYQLVKVNGFKHIGKKFPHEADKLSYLVDLLSYEDPRYISILMNWQTRYVLTVWLSIVILTPFDLKKFNPSSENNSNNIADKLYATLKISLGIHDSCQHATAYCLAKFFSRPDVIKSDLHLSEFISSTLELIANIKPGPANVTMDPELIGHMRTLSYMFKFLPREEMKLKSAAILDVLTKTDVDAINREYVNYLIVKLLQRAGMTLLPKPLAAWRYKRGARILGHQVPSNNHQESNVSIAPASEQMAQPGSDNLQEVEREQEEVAAAEYIESILSLLFVAAQNAQTRVRWSAAKGIARIASRLSRERASDVIDMVLGNFFNETSTEFAWHGGCLTLAEMSRNGLILEEKLESVTKVISQAIIYDRIKGTFAVGAHVREGACYVSWAMARTYEEKLLAPYIPSISVNLLRTMLFDRELQCRRAASATFQELVGRQGTYNDELISILTKVDYQNVGQRPLTYVHLASQVAAFGDKYSQPFVSHLLAKKLCHWDVTIRRLASDSLSALMLHLNRDFLKSEVLPELLRMGEQNLDNNAKHGAILGLAKIIRGLTPLEFNFESDSRDLIDFVGSITKKCEKQLKSKQLATNFLEAIGQIIQSAELANFKYADDSDTLKQWEAIALSTLDSDNIDLREIGSTAILTLYRTYYAKNKTSQDRLLTTLNKSLKSLNESSRCGALRSLAKLGQVLGGTKVQACQGGGEPPHIRTDADTPDIIFTSLTSYLGKKTREVENGDIIFAHAKAEACEAFYQFCYALDKSQLILSSNFISAGYEALVEKTEDYTVDKRGDIGVVVRRAAIKALQDLTLYFLSLNMTSPLDPSRMRKMMARILQQTVYYHNSVRETAALAFYKLVTYQSDEQGNGAILDEQCIPHKREILELFDKFQVNDEFNWRDDSTPLFVSLISKPEYGVDLWTGLVPSIGQVSDLCAKQFREALTSYMQSLDDQTDTLELVLDSYLTALERTDMADRLVPYGLIVADFMLTQGLLTEASPKFQERLLSFVWNSRVGSSTSTSAGSTQTSGSSGGIGDKDNTKNATTTTKSDPKRLISVATVLSSMLQFSGPVQRQCLDHLLSLLTNGYSKVRAHTAEQLYLSTMTYESELGDNLEGLLEKIKPFL